MSDKEETCNVCDDGRSLKKNPIILCDGQDCDVSVHKECYSVKKVPKEEWYCDWCEDSAKDKETLVYCCPKAGARKRTNIPGKYIHVVCAMWNKDTEYDKDTHSYTVTKLEVDKDKCYLCKKKQGICVTCEEPSCLKHFHVTCAIEEDIISPAPTVPSRYSVKCGEHKVTKTKEQRESSAGRGRSRRQRRINHSDDEDDEDMDEDDEDDEEEEDDESKDEESQSGDDDDEPRMANRKASKNGIAAKRRATAAHNGKAGPIKLFLSDQSESDDDMGTTSRKEAKSSKTQPPKTQLPKTSTPNSKPFSLQDRPDPTIPKQLKTDNIKKLTPPSSATSTSSVSSSLALDTPKPTNGTPKQKLPNKAHLVNKWSENAIHKSPTPVAKDLDDLQNDILQGVLQRRNQPVTPSEYNAKPPFGGPPIQQRKMSSSSLADSDIRKAGNYMMKEILQTIQSYQSTELQTLHQQIGRMQEELQRLGYFKTLVADVFKRLNNVPADRIEEHIRDLREALSRAPVSQGDHDRITTSVEKWVRDDT